MRRAASNATDFVIRMEVIDRIFNGLKKWRQWLAELMRQNYLLLLVNCSLN